MTSSNNFYSEYDYDDIDVDEENDEIDTISDIEFSVLHGNQNTNYRVLPCDDGHLEWNSFHNTTKDNKNYGHICYLPNCNISAKIIKVERIHRHEYNLNLSVYSYCIHLKHGEFEWEIVRCYSHFFKIHESLLWYRAHVSMAKKTRETDHNIIRNKKIKLKFPLYPERFIRSKNNIEKRRMLLEEYLNNVLQLPIYREHPNVLNFLEISHLSFIKDLGKKRKEGFVKKRNGGRYADNYFKSMIANWQDRWLFVIKDTFIVYLSPIDWKIREVFLFDNKFRVDILEKNKYIIILKNSQRELKLKFHNQENLTDFLNNIEEIEMNCCYTNIIENSIKSSYCFRQNSIVKVYIDGCNYLRAVADAISLAEDEIFIADWMLSPEILMKRPDINAEWRLDNLLKKKADQGVKIFIRLYKELRQAIGIDSIYTKQKLISMHRENIKVLRHPDGISYWSHHEKIVVIDQKIAFIGGIDLCYGRWDTPSHCLTDLGKRSIKIQNSKKSFFVNRSISLPVNTSKNYPSDYIETAKKPDLIKFNNDTHSHNRNNVKCFRTDQKLKSEQKFLERAALICSFEPKPATPECNKKFPNLKKKILRLSSTESPPKSKIDFAAFEMEDSICNDNNGKFLWLGKDYVNFIDKDFKDLRQPFEDLIDRNKIPRMPWHDVGCSVFGEAARDAARHFIQSWNFAKVNKAKRNENYPFLLPRSRNYDIDKGDLSLNFLFNSGIAKVQLLRSVSNWSVGIKEEEYSIQKAYLKCIQDAKHYIYIENQFFISVTDISYENSDEPKNVIANALYNRIKKAFMENETFRVYIVLPLIPAFEGELGTRSGARMGLIMDWNLKSICKDEKSLLGRLTKLFNDEGRGNIDPSDYISFCSLRGYDKMPMGYVTEFIYVHSKIMIVDDRMAIIGSANINDRSLNGNKDSEVAFLIIDQEFIKSKMNGKIYQAGKICNKLRINLFIEHLGCNDKLKLQDPIIDSFYKHHWLRRAEINTDIFHNVFACFPHNSIRTYSELDDFKRLHENKPIPKEEAENLLKEIRGHLVTLPLDFLIDEKSLYPVSSIENLLKKEFWY